MKPELLEGLTRAGWQTTSSLMSLKGSLASILAASASTEVYASLISKLEHAVPEEDREDYAALQIQRTYRRVTRARKARLPSC